MKGIYMVEIVKANRDWFWRAKSPNGRVIAYSPHAYTRKWFCREMAKKLFKAGIVAIA